MLAEQIVQAEALLASLQEKWAAIFSPNGNGASAPNPGRADSFAGKVRGFLNARPSDSFTIAQVASGMGEADTLKVGRTLFRLHTSGHIQNAGRGVYKAKEDAAA